MADILNFPTSTRMVAIDLTKSLWGKQERKAVINSYEDVLIRKIATAEWRAEGYQDSGMWTEAELEMTRADAFKEALRIYKEWGL